MTQQQQAPVIASGVGQFGNAIMTMMEMVNQIAAGVAGYRKQLVDAGVTAETAEQMSLQLHETLMGYLEPAGKRNEQGSGRGKRS